MNLILLFNKDFISSSQVSLKDGRREHILTVLKSKVSDQLCVGLCDGLMGVGTVVQLESEIILDIVLNQDPPPVLPLTLILALPRPHVLKRSLLCAVSLGIKKIVILNFNRVEKSLWNSSSLREDVIREQLILGLQQAKDTHMPEVLLRKQFKPFVEDELPQMIQGRVALLAHPGAGQKFTRGMDKPITLVIGPEGGIIDYELQKLQDIGFKPFDLGPRILKVESVLPYIVGLLV